MKKFFTLIFTLCILVCSCEKYDNVENIYGVWVFNNYVDNEEVYISFEEDQEVHFLIKKSNEKYVKYSGTFIISNFSNFDFISINSEYGSYEYMYTLYDDHMELIDSSNMTIKMTLFKINKFPEDINVESNANTISGLWKTKINEKNYYIEVIRNDRTFKVKNEYNNIIVNNGSFHFWDEDAIQILFSFHTEEGYKVTVDYLFEITKHTTSNMILTFGDLDGTIHHIELVRIPE